MEGLGSELEEFDVVRILARLHEGREINVNEMHDVDFNEQEEHSDRDIYAPTEMPLVIYTPPLDFKLFSEMLHFNEKAEFWYHTAVQSIELCRNKNLQMLDLFKVGGIFNAFFPKKKVAKFHFLKPPKNFPCLQEIARL